MAGAVLVAGVGGLLGSHVADAFLAFGKEVRGIDNLSGGYKDNVPDEVDFRIADARHPNAYRELLDGVEIVYDCAAAPYEGLSVFSPFYIHQNTSSSAISATSVAIAAGVRRYVYVAVPVRGARDGVQHRGAAQHDRTAAAESDQ
jgi:UDP-glucose 4-epimerase